MVCLSRTVVYGCLVLLLCLVQPVCAESLLVSSGPVVTNIAEVDGQKLSGLRAIVQDSSGFIWLAGNEGLTRYDGRTLKRFTHHKDDPDSVPSNDIRALVKDEDGFLWLGTKGGGLSRFNPQTERFDNFRHEEDDPSTLDSDQINSIAVGKKGVLWVASSTGINRFDRRAMTNRRLDSRIDPDSPQHAENVQLVYEDSEGRLWFSVRRKGLYRYDGVSNRFHHFGIEQGLDGSAVSEVYQSAEGVLWVGTATAIYRFDQVAQRFTRLGIPLKEVNKVDHASVTRIYQDKAANLWVGTFYNGVSLMRAGQSALSEVNAGVSLDDSLNAVHITDIFEDSSGTLWFATSRSGIYKLKPESLQFEHFQVRAKSAHELTGITTMLDGTLLLGSNNGAFRLSGKGGAVVALPGSRGQVTMMASHPKFGTLYYSNKQGLMRVVDNGPPKPVAGARELNGVVQSLAFGDNGSLYVGIDTGLYLYDDKQQRFEQLSAEPVGELLAVAPQFVVAGSNKQGLRLFDSAQRRWAPIGNSKAVIQLLFDSKGQLWATTPGRGLLRLDNASQSFVHINAVLAREVDSIVEQSEGILWLGTGEGLARYDSNLGQYRVFDRRQGQRLGDFSPAMAVRLSGNAMVFANRRELVRFDPQKLASQMRQKRPQGSILLSDFKLFNQAVPLRSQDPNSPLDTTIDNTERLVLDYRQNWFSMVFTSSDFRQPEQLEYSYRMEGLSSQWIKAEALSRTAGFTSLAPGDYVLHFRIHDPQGRWSDQVRLLAITITPPWWASTWAYLLYVLSGLCLILLIYYIRTRQLRARAASLERGIAERTVELKHRADTIARLLEDKDRLIANISHEFRTPLTLILGPLEAQLKAAPDDKSKALLSLAQANGQRLLTMVDQLLDMARLKDQSPSKAVSRDLLHTCRFLVASFRTLARGHNIEIDYQAPREGGLYVKTQPDVLEKILSNLLSNAIKYGGNDQVVTLAVEPCGDTVKISVSDTGPGIAESDQPQIFERFARLNNASGYVPGAGIGLALVKDLVEQHQGSISLHSTVGEGCTFVVELPLESQSTLSDGELSEINEALVQASVEQIELNTRNVPSAVDSGDPDAKKPTILVIEDNQDMRSYIVSCLQIRFHCLEAEDGAQGVELAEKQMPELVVSDVNMPKMDGFEVTRRLKSDMTTGHIPIVLLTARGDRHSRIRGWEEKADEYLEKPFNADELLARIDNILAIRAGLRQQFQLHFDAGNQTEVDSRQSVQTGGVHQLFLNQINDVLENHYQDDKFDVAAFAAAMALSNRQLGRKMRNLLDMTPAEALKRYRLNKAADLLLQGNTASVAAYRCGFSTHSYFSQCFKAQFDCSPSEYTKHTTEQSLSKD